MTRMFVAAYPPPAAREHLEVFLQARQDAGAFRWTVPEQWHLTLAFFAEVPDRSLDSLMEGLERAASKRSAMGLAIAGGGAFPHIGRAKVLWAGLATGDRTELERLAKGCRAAGARAGSPASGGRFRPHLTIARINPPIEATKWVRLLDAYRGPAWRLEEIALVASHLGEGPRRRPRHEVVEVFALAGE
jgi:2'-5' RNA ligase